MSGNRGRVRVEPGSKRIRAYLAGQLVADTITPLFVWEKPYYPTYYFPEGDVRAELVDEGAPVAHSPSRGDARVLTVAVDSARADGAALHYVDSPIEELRGTVRLDWDAMEAWFEEDEEVYTHARDPYTRVDILASSRNVRIQVDGVTVADSNAPRLLFETELPVRYYLPRTHVRMELLERSQSVTHCPYKGRAEAWNVLTPDGVHQDLAWSYRAPLAESQKIAGMICFYNEKVDIEVDGVLQDRPSTRFS